MGHKFSFCKTCETPLDCDFCDKLDALREEVHACWIEYDDGDGSFCTHCGADYRCIVEDAERYIYCPHCGAKMDKEAQK